MVNELITVIVPVYNVEQYLDKCVDSILSQTYSNIEVVLVDDGSTDDSGKMCDEYKKKDNRIVVIHQTNQGLSGARNSGIDIAKGVYITFIDSDDYVSKKYIEFLYTMICDNSADIASCKEKKFYEVSDIVEEDVVKSSVQIYKKEQALENMLYRRNVDSYAVGKLYKKVLFQEIRFPVGVLFEDTKTIYKVYDLIDKIAVSSEGLYYYLQRRGSIVNSSFDKKKMEQVWASEEIVEFVSRKYPQLLLAAVSKYFISAIDVYRKIPNNVEYKKEKKELEYIIRKYRKDVLKDKNNKLLTRLIALLAMISVSSLNYLGKIYQFLTMKRILKLKNPI